MTPPRRPAPSAAEIAAAVAELRRRATVARFRAASHHGAQAAEMRAEATAYTAVADWLAAPIPSPDPETGAYSRE